MALTDRTQAWESEDGAVTLHFYINQPRKAAMYYGIISEVYGKQFDDGEVPVMIKAYANEFCLWDSTIIRWEYDANADETGMWGELIEYLTHREYDVVTNFQTALNLSDDVSNALYEGYRATRQHIPPASEVLREGLPVETPLPQNSKKNGGKSTKKKP